MRGSCINHPPNEMVSIGQKWAVDLCQGDTCSALIIGYFQLIHIGRLPKPFLIGSTDIEAGLMGGYKRNAIARSIRRLVQSGLLTSHWLTDEESADHCKTKDPAILGVGHLRCEWCESITIAINKHHYPIRDRDGGADTVSICASCHSEFHYLSETIFYRPSDKLLELFEVDPLSLEDVL